MRVPPWYETKQEDIIRSVERMLTHVAQSPLATLLPAHLPFSGTILNQWLSNVITVASMFQLVPALNLVEALSNRIHGPLSSDLRIHHIGLIGLVARVFLRGSPKLADVRDQIAHLTMQEASMRDFRARLTEHLGHVEIRRDVPIAHQQRGLGTFSRFHVLQISMIRDSFI